MKNDKEVIVYGCSPFINKVNDLIPILQDKYFGIGINRFSLYYPNIDLSFFYDTEGLESYRDMDKSTHILTQKVNEIKLKEYGFTNVSLFTPAYHIIDNNAYNNILGIFGYSITCVLNHCYKQGFKTVYLLGNDLTETWNHFYDPPEAIPRQADPGLIKMARDVIYKYDKDYLDIIQLNEESDMLLRKRNPWTL